LFAIIGSTGLIGSHLIEMLDHTKVIAMVRSRHDASLLAARGVQSVLGDLSDVRSIHRLLRQAEAVFVATNLTPDQIRLQNNLTHALASHPHVHVVKISGLGTSLTSPIRSGRWHAQIERRIEGSGNPFTFLRPPYFMQNLLHAADDIRVGGVLRSPLQHEPIAMIDASDIARVAASVLGRRQHFRKRYWLSGPRTATMAEVARELRELTGRAITHRLVSDAWLSAHQRRLGTPHWRVEVVREFNEAFRRGDGNRVTSRVEQITGMQPRSLRTFLAEHAEQFARDST
jgi:uncharacterized protein YbjT (DUF2867 family)